MPSTIDTDLRTEREKVEDWRTRELVRAGYPPDNALTLAMRSDVDLHQAIALLDNGCKVKTAMKILI
jgi:hypothetical protein